MQLAGDQAKMLTANATTESSPSINAFRKKQAQRSKTGQSNPHQQSYGTKPTQQQDQRPRRPCGNCGTFHKRRECPAYGKTCRKCNKLNHYGDYCRGSRRITPLTPNLTRRRKPQSPMIRNCSTLELSTTPT